MALFYLNNTKVFNYIPYLAEKLKQGKMSNILCAIIVEKSKISRFNIT
jgi:hypothetical protein